jgi:hypothetical protein
VRGLDPRTDRLVPSVVGSWHPAPVTKERPLVGAPAFECNAHSSDPAPSAGCPVPGLEFLPYLPGVVIGVTTTFRNHTLL